MARAAEVPAAFVTAIEAAHHAPAATSAGVISSDFEVVFGGSTFIAGRMAFTPSLSHVRMEVEPADGTASAVYVFRDGEAFVSPASHRRASGPDARFHVLTWPYFVALPYKLNDPGTRFEPASAAAPAPGLTTPPMRMTFAEGVGDAPDDWYLLFKDDADRLAAAAYIVSYGVEDPENASPSVILYDGFEDVSGLPVATRWTFHHYDPVGGVRGEPKGTATLSRLMVMPFDETLFEVPADARSVPAP